jgi:starch-binding outer membrane protein, SusD/RagB family
MRLYYKYSFRISIYTFCICLLVSCSKLVEVDPPITNTNGDNVFNEDHTAMAVMTGLYTKMSSAYTSDLNGRLTNIFFTTGLTGDELDLNDRTNTYYNLYYSNNISPIESTWFYIYNMIFIANSAIEKLPTGTQLTPSVKNQALGEAKFMRGLCYFYLVNLYGGVPLALSTDYKATELLPRASVEELYDQILLDVKDAQSLLSATFVGNDGVSATDERTRPNHWAATALLARVYLYRGRWQEAEAESNKIIENNSLFSLADLNTVFIKNNREAIWQLQPVGVPEERTANTREGQLLKILPENNTPLVTLSENLAGSFDSRDMRRQHWISSVTTTGGLEYIYASKYKIGDESHETQEYSTVMRLAEQYLIRAESRINMGRVADGIEDLNTIRSRATDLNADPADQLSQLSPSLSKEEALLAVENERRHELFTEWGHRWFDLKRTERADAVLAVVKPGWQTTDQLFPLPGNDVATNINLRGHQNAGY